MNATKYDPAKIATEARKYQDEQHKLGKVVDTKTAVNHILQSVGGTAALSATPTPPTKQRINQTPEGALELAQRAREYQEQMMKNGFSVTISQAVDAVSKKANPKKQPLSRNASTSRIFAGVRNIATS
ncbi:MAG: hypothetical protein LBV45_01100 [Xanthomonadaceae bacterium]|jgi:hypothetical protein|nr:hypothetical protein [Xanthomonadaceae bacterium]